MHTRHCVIMHSASCSPPNRTPATPIPSERASESLGSVSLGPRDQGACSRSWEPEKSITRPLALNQSPFVRSINAGTRRRVGYDMIIRNDYSHLHSIGRVDPSTRVGVDRRAEGPPRGAPDRSSVIGAVLFCLAQK